MFGAGQCCLYVGEGQDYTGGAFNNMTKKVRLAKKRPQLSILTGYFQTSGVRLQITCAQITVIHYWCFSWMVFKPASLLLHVSEPLKLSITVPDAVDSQLFN